MSSSTWTRVEYGHTANPGVYDTGNGALMIIEECRSYPGVERCTVTSYCGRDGQDTTYYRVATAPKEDQLYRSPDPAAHAATYWDRDAYWRHDLDVAYYIEAVRIPYGETTGYRVIKHDARGRNPIFERAGSRDPSNHRKNPALEACKAEIDRLRRAAS